MECMVQTSEIIVNYVITFSLSKNLYEN